MAGRFRCDGWNRPEHKIMAERPRANRDTRPRAAPMPKHVRGALKEHYRPYDDRLAKWLGHEPSWRT
jgi:hypothetical protein